MINIISIINVFLPSFLIALFYKRDYKNLVKNSDNIHILTASLNNYSIIKALFFFKNDLKIIYTLHDPKSHNEKISFVGKFVKEYSLSRIYKLSQKNENFYIHLHSDNLILDCPKEIGNIIIKSHPLPVLLTSIKKRRKSDIYRIGFLGKIEEYKGLSVLFQSLKKVDNEKLFEFELVIVGKGEIRDNWLTLDANIEIFNENVTDLFFHETISNIDVLVLPYISATQSGVGYMGLAYEVPIIATKTGGLPDIIKSSKNGRLIMPNNMGQLIRALNDLSIELKSI